MASTRPISSADSDQEFLDSAFERAVEQMEEGLHADVDELLDGREHLRVEVEELLRLAHTVATGAADRRLPHVAGFTLMHEIGRGGMGAVYLAKQDRLGGRLVALKVLPSTAMVSSKARQRFRTEAHAIAKLRHDHIVAVHDIVQDEHSHAFAMEWVEGASLSRVIEQLAQQQANSTNTTHQDDVRMNALRSVLDSPEECFTAVTWPAYVVRLGVAMARALDAVHGAGMLHRDVKPSNILIRRDGTPLLSDFGLARETDATVTNVGSFAGTAAYAAPEQLQGHVDLDSRADIYSLGATLYHALALRMPYSGSSATQMMRQIERGTALPLRRINRKLPVDLQTVIAKAMDADPNLRYQTAAEFANDLQRLMNLQPIKAKPAGLLVRASKLARRNRAALVAAVIGGALTIGIVALVLTYFIGFPIWSRAKLDEARLVLLDPEQSDAMFSAMMFDYKHAGGLPLSLDAIDRSLAQYDAAVRFAPFDKDLARERKVVRLARQITTRPTAAPIFFESQSRFPLTTAFGASVHSGWATYETVRDHVYFDADQLQSASDEDLRALGLLALLCGESQTSMDSWTALDRKGSSDAMVEASFGIAYLVSKQYGRAYPRLRKAVEAFPNIGFLTVYLAEAAAKCGDFDKAQDWLDQARSMPRHDRFNGLKRVQAGLYAAVGNDDRARQAYEELLEERKNIVAFEEYVQFLETRGDLERALIVYLRLISHGSVREDLYRRFTDATERWWDGLDDHDRRKLIQANDPWTDHRLDREGILPTYAKCLSALGAEPPADGIPRNPNPRE